MGRDMLYIGWKDLPLGVRFERVDNESAHENKKNITGFRKNINLFKTEMPEMEMHETALSSHTHTYLSCRTLHIQIIG